MSYYYLMDNYITGADAQLLLTDGWLKVRGFDMFPVDRLTGDMRAANVLDFSMNSFSTLPDELGSMFPNARVIFLSGTKMNTLPAGLVSCAGLEMVGARGSDLQKIDITALPQSLKVLTLTGNNIAEIPADIHTLPMLEKLCMSGNVLTEVPEDLAGCQNLEMLRVASNQIEREPAFLDQLPQLKWYNDAGNVFSISSNATDLPKIDATRLRLEGEVGRSANNRVIRATLDGTEEVAVKVYGAELSTDGAIADEIAAMCAARGVEGAVVAQGVARIDGRTAVVMPLVGSDYTQLAAPPDLHRYTRDRYDDTRTFTEKEAEMLIDTVHQIVQALHNKGITHGDIYAHNLLYCAGGDVLLNDFGAASLIAGEGEVRRAIDMRACAMFAQEIRARIAN